MNIKIFINGFGCVGRALAKIIVEKRDVTKKKYGLRIEVAAIKDSSGAVFSREGLDISDLLKLIEYPRSSIGLYEPYGRMDIGLDKIYDQCSPDIHVELTPSNYEGGEPRISNVFYALSRGANIVLANKAVPDVLLLLGGFWLFLSILWCCFEEKFMASEAYGFDRWPRGSENCGAMNP